MLILVLILALLLVGILLAILSWIHTIKNIVTFNNRHIIEDAINRYNVYANGAYKNPSLISLDNMEPHAKTLWRWNDWGFYNIVPKEIFLKINNFIKE